jgi:glutathione synthase/RimK-type ligase-like ATP-grasp enzyme
MSLPSAVQRAESKILQLQIASTVGFACPETLISNDPTEIRAFFRWEHQRVVAKPLRLGYFNYGDSQSAVYTTALATSDLADDDALTAAPVIYQQHVEKQCDIRVTVIGSRIFAAAIHSQTEASARIDWRRSEVDLAHTIHDLPEEIAQACIRLVEKLHLKFGAIDLILTPEGRYYFLEINPNGQWLWLEDKLGFMITDAIASWLRQRE